MKTKILEFRFVAQFIYTRFCQANAFAGRLAEDIVIDLTDIKNDIRKFREIGDITMEYILSQYGEKESVGTKKEKYEEVIHICNTYLERMKKVLLATKQKSKNPDDRFVIKKEDLTLEEGERFISVLIELKNQAKETLNKL